MSLKIRRKILITGTPIQVLKMSYIQYIRMTKYGNVKLNTTGVKWEVEMSSNYTANEIFLYIYIE